MATRGTYQFTSSIDENIKTFYIHHDNYVEGAKEKLQNCSSVSFFMIKNPEAEPIKSHDDYSDTEYRYDVHFTPEKMGFRKGNFPISEKHAQRAFSIPIFYNMKNIDIMRVVRVLREIFKK